MDQSTLGEELGSLLGIPFIPLDTLAWRPGWLQTPEDDFRSNVVAAMSRADNGWVIDGNYFRMLGTLVEDQATDIICKFFNGSTRCITFPGTCVGLENRCAQGLILR